MQQVAGVAPWLLENDRQRLAGGEVPTVEGEGRLHEQGIGNQRLVKVLVQVEKALFEPSGVAAVVLSRAIIKGINRPQFFDLGLSWASAHQRENRDQAGDNGVRKAFAHACAPLLPDLPVPR